jgi:D-alanyl-D-alanine carboxypeptidase
VIDDGALVQVVSGVANLDTRAAVTPATQFRVASTTKMYIATIALRLVERGELSLDDPIGAHEIALPESLAFARAFTLRQLLSHTSGLSQTFTRDEDRHRTLSTIDLLERVPPPVCAPSACWSYADGNYVLAQMVLEAATKQSLGELFTAELVEPLGLRRTSLVDPGANVSLPSQYALASDEFGRPLQPRRLFEQSLPRITTLVTTAADAARFADALFNGEMLKPASLSQMLDTGVMRDLPCPDGCRFKYGLGAFHFDVAGHQLVGHDGSSGAVVVHDRQRGSTVAILTNGGDQDMKAFLEAVLHAIGDADRDRRIGPAP